MNWRIFVWISFLLSYNSIYSCSLNPKKEYISLSNSVSYLFQELGLLNDPNWKGVSEYHPIDRKKFKGKVFHGGIYLSLRTLRSFKNKVVFFDQSRDLKRGLEKIGDIDLIEFSSRGKNPWESLIKTIEVTKKITQNCDSKLKEILEFSKRVKNKINTMKKIDKRIFFFLGQLSKKTKNSHMIMLNDGFTGALINSKKITSYPSDLAYLIPSQRILRRYPNSMWLGVVPDYNGEWKIEKVEKNKVNLSSPLFFSAGLGHLRVLNRLTDYLITLN